MGDNREAASIVYIQAVNWLYVQEVCAGSHVCRTHHSLLLLWRLHSGVEVDCCGESSAACVRCVVTAHQRGELCGQMVSCIFKSTPSVCVELAYCGL